MECLTRARKRLIQVRISKRKVRIRKVSTRQQNPKKTIIKGIQNILHVTFAINRIKIKKRKPRKFITP